MVFFLNLMKELVLRNLFGLEAFATMDYFFLYDNEKNRCNILTIGIFTKFETERVLKQFRERAFKFARLRQRVVRVLGVHYW